MIFLFQKSMCEINSLLLNTPAPSNCVPSVHSNLRYLQFSCLQKAPLENWPLFGPEEKSLKCFNKDCNDEVTCQISQVSAGEFLILSSMFSVVGLVFDQINLSKPSSSYSSCIGYIIDLIHIFEGLHTNSSILKFWKILLQQNLKFPLLSPMIFKNISVVNNH